MKAKLIFSLVVIVLLLSITKACKEKQKAQPELPPAETFEVKNIEGDSVMEPKNHTEYGYNWWASARIVFVWRYKIGEYAGVPIVAYKEAFNHQPVYTDDEKWLWEYSFTYESKTYGVKLYGYYEDTTASWEMHVSLDNVFQDFVWITGTSNNSGSEGKWIINGSYDEPYPLFDIDWTYNRDDNTRSVKFTVKDDKYIDDEMVGYILYQNDLTGDFDTYYDIMMNEFEDQTQIYYNSKLKNGKIKSEYFDFIGMNDGKWHCWNEQAEDIECN